MHQELHEENRRRSNIPVRNILEQPTVKSQSIKKNNARIEELQNMLYKKQSYGNYINREPRNYNIRPVKIGAYNFGSPRLGSNVKAY